ncbi:Por secretion system C-terminal sorting domain-containing protein [Chryseobacterium taeanense]|uniref:Por secretion system C-terminal sorting domain-containing protein n=1 Tax=Chryseobacterium taeanense TaxID=311334 RepID=A0A1G8MBK4_9FLAO|nr:T9SS type A sorting domain-containing protein [Chryseobacterium taeanense]SDI65326.1 Por secretion system C-terminal sorting domain-containing protein [Chryseobacterium taeanense]
MKKIFTSLAVLFFAATAFSQVITQSSTPTVIATSGSVACGNSTAGYTADNSYLRVFKLSDYGISYAYKITNIAFGVQTANNAFPVDVTVYNWTGGTFPTGTPTELATVPVNLTAASAGTVVNTGATLNANVPAGGTFVVEIFHDGTNTTPPQQFYMGTNAGAQTGPSYIVSETCSILTPTATGTGALASFASARWVMTITGQNATLGTTEVINSRDLQIYPNPVKDVLKFKFSNNLKSESIEIYDLSGRAITSINNSKNVNEVNMSSYQKGNYVLRVKASDGKVYIQKIIKE